MSNTSIKRITTQRVTKYNRSTASSVPFTLLSPRVKILDWLSQIPNERINIRDTEATADLTDLGDDINLTYILPVDESSNTQVIVNHLFSVDSDYQPPTRSEPSLPQGFLFTGKYRSKGIYIPPASEYLIDYSQSLTNLTRYREGKIIFTNKRITSSVIYIEASSLSNNKSVVGYLYRQDPEQSKPVVIAKFFLSRSTKSLSIANIQIGTELSVKLENNTESGVYIPFPKIKVAVVDIPLAPPKVNDRLVSVKGNLSTPDNTLEGGQSLTDNQGNKLSLDSTSGILRFINGEGEELFRSPRGRVVRDPPFKLVLRDDGNLVVYAGKTKIWASGKIKPTKDGSYTLILENGRAGLHYTGNPDPVWSIPGDKLVSVPGNKRGPTNILSGGNFLSDKSGNKLTLSAITGVITYTDNEGKVLFTSTNSQNIVGAYTLVMKDDGNLVVYCESEDGSKQLVWESGKSGPKDTYVLLLHSGRNQALIYSSDIGNNHLVIP